jgi:hypothetical protein
METHQMQFYIGHNGLMIDKDHPVTELNILSIWDRMSTIKMGSM